MVWADFLLVMSLELHSLNSLPVSRLQESDLVLSFYSLTFLLQQKFPLACYEASALFTSQAQIHTVY